ncbi:MAG TPA: sugar ABC transporter permease [Actinomycetota bacterium]|nr:sugar ABC transporter permease [Actinomycetota bacterium]
MRSMLRSAEIDARLAGMLAALAIIWIIFQIITPSHTFLTPRNLWNLSVQTSVVAIMATGMVLIIVTRNIDLSVGAVMAAVGMVMAVVQHDWLPDLLRIDHPATWIIAGVVGLVLGAAIGAFQGVIVAYVGVPSFIVTLGGFLVWRGVAWWVASGQTIAPMDTLFRRLGGGADGTIGGTWSWVVGLLACVGIVAMQMMRRRQRARYGFRLRPMWAEVALGVVACGAVLLAIGYLNRYYLPPALAEQRGAPPGANIPLGLAIPVLIAVGTAIVMTFIATRRRFGRYVYGIGGNPEAAELAGIKTKRTIVKTFALMGFLVGLAGAVQIARLNAAVSSLGTGMELNVIAAAVIGGTSFAGGIGTVAGAVLGALVMQSLVSGMVLMGVEAPLQDVVVGIVLVLAVTLDTVVRRRAAR